MDFALAVTIAIMITFFAIQVPLDPEKTNFQKVLATSIVLLVAVSLLTWSVWGLIEGTGAP